jgi:predicted permease
MSWTRFFRRRYWDEERARELDAYLEAETDENIARGMSPEDARYAAHRKLGNTTLIREEIYRMNSLGWLETLWQDLRFALRQLRNNPGLTTVIVLSLGLGIGVNTAVFTVTDAVMVRMLPVKNPRQLVLLGWVRRHTSLDVSTSGYGLPDPHGREVRASFAYPLIDELRGQNKAFANVFGFVPTGFGKESVNVSIDGQAEMTDGVMVTGSYFSGLGIVPVVGRLITDADVKASAPRVAVISYSYWTRRFARDPSAVGKASFVNGVPFTIVGVTPPEFFGLQPGVSPDIWVPLLQDEKLVPYGLAARRARDLWTRADWWWVMVVVRLQPGVTEQQALTTARVPFFASVRAAAKKDLKPEEAPELVLVPASRGLDMLRFSFSRPLWVLTAVVGLVLLIACANIATLLIAQAAVRQREMGVRLSLGASRWRLIRQLLTESILLASMGGLLALLLAQWGSHTLLVLMMGNGQSLALGNRPDLAVLAFCVGVSLFTGILSGLAPALRATGVDVTPTLKESAGGFATPGAGRLRLGKALVAAQVGVTLLLLVGAGLFVRTLANLETLNLGFNPHNLIMFAVDPTKNGYEGQRLLSLCDLVCERLAAVPGVRAVTSSELPLLNGWTNNGPIAIEGYQPKANQDMQVYWDAVGPGFFDTMGIRLLLGRPIDRRDTEKSPKVAVVNEALARHFFGDINPIGRRFSLDEKLDPARMYEIVGVVDNAKYDKLRSDPLVAYLPYSQMASMLGRMYFEVRTAGNPAAFIAAIRSTMHQIDPTLGLEELKTQTQQIAEDLTQERMFAELCSLFGLLALALAAIGLYGLLAYTVARRTNEIGIRMALGAQQRQVLYLVLRQSAGLVAAGVTLGLLAALATTRLIASELYGLKPTDPLTLGFATFFLLAVAGLAAYFPARRATRVDPMVALRHE